MAHQFHTVNSKHVMSTGIIAGGSCHCARGSILEAVGSANRAAPEGIKGVGEWQMKILNQTLDEVAKTLPGP
jgi:hypothetical protein